MGRSAGSAPNTRSPASGGTSPPPPPRWGSPPRRSGPPAAVAPGTSERTRDPDDSARNARLYEEAEAERGSKITFNLNQRSDDIIRLNLSTMSRFVEGDG